MCKDNEMSGVANEMSGEVSYVAWYKVQNAAYYSTMLPLCFSFNLDT